MDKLEVNQILTPKDLAEYLRVSKTTVNGWRDRGLPYIKLGSKIYFYGPDFVQWCLKHRRTRQGVALTDPQEPHETPAIDPPPES